MALEYYDGIPTDFEVKGTGSIFVPPTELETLYFFGMPRDRQPRRYVVSPGDEFASRYRDFVIEFFGVEGGLFDGYYETLGPSRQVGPKWAVRLGRLTSWGTPGSVLHYAFDDGRDVVLYVWRQRIIPWVTAGTAPFIESVWEPQSAIWHAFIRNIIDPDKPETVTAVKKLADILPLLELSLGEKTISGYTSEQIEEMITTTIDTLAKAQLDKNRPRRFKVKQFVDAWPIAIGRTTIYNYVARDRLAANGEIETRYKKRCAELAPLE